MKKKDDPLYFDLLRETRVEQRYGEIVIDDSNGKKRTLLIRGIKPILSYSTSVIARRAE